MASLTRLSRSLLRANTSNALKRNFSSQASSKSKQYSLVAGATAAAAFSAAAGIKFFNSQNSLSFLPTVHASPCPYAPQERTFIMIKPDGVARGLIGDIIKRFEQRGYKLVAMKMMTPTEDLLNVHYGDLKTKPFFPGLVKFISSGPVVAMVWEGKSVVKQGRQMLGETNPLASKPGSIRGDFSIDMGRNIIHGSDSVESANEEINLWFDAKEIQTWRMPAHDQVYE